MCYHYHYSYCSYYLTHLASLRYVRMVRSAGMHHCAEAVKFVPDLHKVPQFTPLVGPDGANLSAGTVRAATNLDAVVATLTQNFVDGRDYFAVLVNVFKQVLLGGAAAAPAGGAEGSGGGGEDGGVAKHLALFYLIVPSLCLSWLDASLAAHDSMLKANRSRDAYYSDDGFAVGVAFVLEILGQGAKFDSLHWFDSIREKLAMDRAALRKQTAAAAERKAARLARAQAKKKSSGGFFSRAKPKAEEESDSDGEDELESGAVHTMQITGTKLAAMTRESELLFFSLSGARIFFKNSSKGAA